MTDEMTVRIYNHQSINHVGLLRVWIPLQQVLSASLPSSFDPHFHSQNHYFPFQLSLAPLLPRHLPHHFPAQVGCPRCLMMLQAKQIQGRCNKSAFAVMKQQMITDREMKSYCRCTIGGMRVVLDFPQAFIEPFPFVGLPISVLVLFICKKVLGCKECSERKVKISIIKLG